MTGRTFKQRLGGPEPLAGVMVFEFSTHGVARIAAAAGADFLLVDQEHTALSGETVRALLAAGRASALPTLVRVPAADRHLIAQALDAGAAGIMVPMVADAAQARMIVDAAKYPPQGSRGFGLLYADEYVEGDVAATIERANREQVVIAQIETAAGLDAAAEIAATPGIDALWIGQFDLTIDMGIPGGFDTPEFLRAVEQLLAAGKPVGIAVPGPEEALAELRRGFSCVAFSDVDLFERSLRAATDAIGAPADRRGAHQGPQPGGSGT